MCRPLGFGTSPPPPGTSSLSSGTSSAASRRGRSSVGSRSCVLRPLAPTISAAPLAPRCLVVSCSLPPGAAPVAVVASPRCQLEGAFRRGWLVLRGAPVGVSLCGCVWCLHASTLGSRHLRPPACDMPLGFLSSYFSCHQCLGSFLELPLPLQSSARRLLVAGVGLRSWATRPCAQLHGRHHRPALAGVCCLQEKCWGRGAARCPPERGRQGCVLPAEAAAGTLRSLMPACGAGGSDFRAPRSILRPGPARNGPVRRRQAASVPFFARARAQEREAILPLASRRDCICSQGLGAAQAAK